jgi:L,D-peptidoglycan transpeptidase YkuD (ErfK/YbiS/YcfS/YnhG family)
MSAILRLCFLLLYTLASWAQGLSPECKQVMLVSAPDGNRPKATLQRYQRQAEQWRAVGQPIPVVLGRNGLAWGLSEEVTPGGTLQKKEGDNRSPAGVYQVSALWLRKGIPGPPAGGFAVHRIHSDTVGVDDPKSRYYNRILRSGQIHEPDWDSWEKMDISDYDRVLVISHNVEQPKPGQGSCIFMHRWEGPDKATSGCTAMAEKDLIQVIEWLRPDCKPRLVQLTREQVEPWLKAHEFPTGTH